MLFQESDSGVIGSDSRGGLRREPCPNRLQLARRMIIYRLGGWFTAVHAILNVVHDLLPLSGFVYTNTFRGPCIFHFLRITKYAWSRMKKSEKIAGNRRGFTSVY